MIFSSSLCFLTLLSLFGYSYIFKKLIKNKNQIILNQDIFFGIFLAIFLSLFFNFFFPLKYFSLPVLILGIIFFIVGYKKKNLSN